MNALRIIVSIELIIVAILSFITIAYRINDIELCIKKNKNMTQEEIDKKIAELEKQIEKEENNDTRRIK